MYISELEFAIERFLDRAQCPLRWDFNHSLHHWSLLSHTPFCKVSSLYFETIIMLCPFPLYPYTLWYTLSCSFSNLRNNFSMMVVICIHKDTHIYVKYVDFLNKNYSVSVCFMYVSGLNTWYWYWMNSWCPLPSGRYFFSHSEP